MNINSLFSVLLGQAPLEEPSTQISLESFLEDKFPKVGQGCLVEQVDISTGASKTDGVLTITVGYLCQGGTKKNQPFQYRLQPSLIWMGPWSTTTDTFKLMPANLQEKMKLVGSLLGETVPREIKLTAEILGATYGYGTGTGFIETEQEPTNEADRRCVNSGGSDCPKPKGTPAPQKN